MIRANTKVNLVADALAAQVISNEIKPGERLPAIRDLARNFGVSHVTASQAINALSISGLIDVRPGVGAFAANKNDSDDMPRQLTIGIAILNRSTTNLTNYSGVNHPSIAHMLNGFNSYFPDERASAKLLAYNDFAGKESAVAAAVRSGSLDGLIVAGPITPAEIDFVHDNNVALVLCNHLLPERVVPKVFINWQSGFKKLLSKLIDLGHDRIELITYREEWLIKQKRGGGYVGSANSLGLKEFSEDSIHIIDNTINAVDRECYDSVVKKVMQKQPTAIIAFDEIIANRVVRYCYDQGMSIPSDISLVAMNDMTPDSHPFALTSLDVQAAYADVIYESCGIIERMARGQVVSHERVMINTSVIEGESVGKA